MAERTLSLCPAPPGPLWYEGVGHMPFWEAADSVQTRELAEFSDQIGSEPPSASERVQLPDLEVVDLLVEARPQRYFRFFSCTSSSSADPAERLCFFFFFLHFFLCLVTWVGAPGFSTFSVTVPVSLPKPKASKLFTWNESVPTKPWFGMYVKGSPASSCVRVPFVGFVS